MQAAGASASDIIDYFPLTVPVQPVPASQTSPVSGEAEITLNYSLAIKASAPKVWAALRQLAGWPEWFGADETITPIYDGPHFHTGSPFSHFFDRLTPFQSASRAAYLHCLVPGQIVSWCAQGREMTALHLWRLEMLDADTTRVSVEVGFNGMSRWYFNVMAVAAKMQINSQALLERLRVLAAK